MWWMGRHREHTELDVRTIPRLHCDRYDTARASQTRRSRPPVGLIQQIVYAQVDGWPRPVGERGGEGAEGILAQGDLAIDQQPFIQPGLKMREAAADVIPTQTAARAFQGDCDIGQPGCVPTHGEV